MTFNRIGTVPAGQRAARRDVPAAKARPAGDLKSSHRNEDRSAEHCSACEACEVIESAEQRYLDHILVAPTREQSHAQAIADTLGFCVRHGALIAGCEGHAAAITRTRMLRGAIELTLEMLETGKIGNEITRDLLFQSANACPACTYSAAQLTRNLARAVGPRKNGVAPRTRFSSLCFSHYRDAISLTGAAHLLPFAKAELARVKATIGSFPSRDVTVQEASPLRLLGGNRGLLPRRHWDTSSSEGKTVGAASRSLRIARNLFRARVRPPCLERRNLSPLWMDVIDAFAILLCCVYAPGSVAPGPKTQTLRRSPGAAPGRSYYVGRLPPGQDAASVPD